MAAHHEMFDGQLRVYKRDGSQFWQCSAHLNGHNHRMSTKVAVLAEAKDVAEDWFIQLRGLARSGELKTGKTFKVAADQFRKEYEALTAGERNPKYVKDHWNRLRVYLVPYFGKMMLEEITPGVVQEYRVHRMTVNRDKETDEPIRPSRTTMHQEMVTLRHVLRTAERHGWITFVPDLSAPYKKSGKVTHRAWFSPSEYKTLYEATRERAADPLKPRWAWATEQLHDFVLFMVNTGLRPDEAWNLQFRDVQAVKYEGARDRILEIEVRGKRGVGYCKSMPGAVRPFERLK